MVLLHLPATLDLGAGQLLRIRGVHVGDASHVHEDHARVRRPVPGALDPGQPVATVRGSVTHARHELGPGDGGRPLHVHVGDLEQGREGLHRAPVSRGVVRNAGHGGHVGVPGGIDEHRRLDPALAALRPQPDRGHSSTFHPHARGPRVQQQVHAGILGKALPEDLQGLGIVGDPGAGPVGVGTLERDAVRRQPLRDLPRQPADHTPPVRARCVERVERVKDGRRCPAHERQPVHEERSGAISRGRDRRAGTRGPGPDHHDIERITHRAGPSRTVNRRAGFASRIRRVACSPRRRRSRGANVVIRYRSPGPPSYARR